MERRVLIQWTNSAKKSLKKLPPKVRRGLLEKADHLYESDPREANKALTGPLQGYYRIVYGRYRAVYHVKEEKSPKGGKTLHVIVCFVIAGIRKEHDQNDVYRIAQKLVKLLIDDDDLLSQE